MDLPQLTVAVFLAISATVFNQVCLAVTTPFIDEIFHLRQCKFYCKHQFLVWDNKITTPPGLYILGTVYSHILHAFGVKNSCGQDALRSLNLIGGVVVLPLILSMVRTSNYWKINVISLPLMNSYYFLFYTDVWSTLLVVACVMRIVKSRTLKGAVLANVLGLVSLLFRQTNIVWIAFTGLLMIDMRRQKRATSGENIVSFIKQAVCEWQKLVPFALNGLLFAVFIKVNGGITFGDKENHQVSFHLVQIFYCFTFMAFLTLPVWVGKHTLKSYFRFAIVGHNGLNAIITIASLAAIRYVIHNFTVVHPFLLADNRHYTFYIYRRILSKPHADLVMAPIYHFSTWLVYHCLALASKSVALSMSPLLICAFFASVALTLIPSPLFEPRYYIVPLVLFRIFIRPESSRPQRHLYEFLWYSFINVVYFIVFFSYEFTWPTEAGTQRIIW